MVIASFLLKRASRTVGVDKSLVSSCKYSITQACISVINQILLQIFPLLGRSMEDVFLPQVSYCDSIHENPKKSQYSFENVFSISYDESLFSSLVSPPQKKTCHHCGLFGSLRCSQCKQIYYCSVDCQKEDWPAHPSVDSLKTEERIKKITLSDLQALGIKKAMEVQGIVTEFKSPSEFYIQLSSPDILDQISKLSLKLQDCYASTVIEEQYIATRGEVCVAKCSLDQTWNRALVKDVDILQKKSQVFYIDYGNEEDIPLAWIKALHKDIELILVSSLFCYYVKHYVKKSPLCYKMFFLALILRFVYFCNKYNTVCSKPLCMLTLGQLAELQVSLNEHCDKLPSSPAFRPPVGNVCCAQFTEDNRWYRAAVVAYVSEEAVVAEYIDYGNSEVLPLSRLRPVIPRLMDLPAQAIRCTLAGVKRPLGEWTSEDICFMKQLVEDKVFTVKVVGKHSYRSVVELVDASVTPAINVSSHLIERGCRAEEPRMALPAIGMNDIRQANGEYEHVLICKWNKLTLEQTVDVIVCTLYSPGEFYCHISNNSELHALNLLNKSLSEYCQKTPPNVSKPENGEPCCAFFSAKNWIYLLKTKCGTVKVCFVDYGNVEEVPLDKIRQISSSFLKLPFQGIKCWLSGIKPGSSKWIPEATARFHTYAVGIKLQARVTSLSRDGAGVELIDNSTGRPKVINELLTSEKLAVKEVLQEKNKLPNKEGIHCIFLLFLLETSLGHWKSIKLAIDETMSVCVTEVVSPGLFYAVPVKTKGKQKWSLFLISDELCFIRWYFTCGGFVLIFSGDGRWYRALVLKAFRSVVEVLYADYGNKETLPLSEVLPITDSYLKLPFQAIICSLAGIEKAEWSPLLLGKLKEMLLNKYITITVKGINENVNLVTVEKLWENGSLNVAGKLVMEGLVKSSSTKCCCTELKIQVRFSPSNTLLRFQNLEETPCGGQMGVGR
uniref:Tudor domain containing 1 n=1 Tax=Strigops habroptila TaxID=2489341 RepID=A0A672V0V3_STRHB